MASICRDPDGRKRIVFTGKGGKRKVIRLGKAGIKYAESVVVRVQALAVAAMTNLPWDPETAAWVAGLIELDSKLYDKLQAVGLVPPKAAKDKPAVPLLGAFLQSYIDGRSDVKPRTKINLGQARNNLVRFFGEDKPLGEITLGDADEFRRDLLGRLGENTARRHCGRAKQFFRAAVRKELIAKNPFGDMKGCAVKASHQDRLYFVTRADAQKVLDACIDAQWRLLFALARFGGLRTPSEPLGLRWTDVDWERDRITIRSPKTEHHEGGESRQIPIFPELRGPLNEVWEQAEPGSEFVITRYRDSGVNLRTQLERIIRKAGLEPWPKLWQNLRATRETELAEKHPIHLVCYWLGNSALVAKKHYLQIRDQDFTAAANPADGAATTGGAQSGAPQARQVAQKAAQTPDGSNCQPSPNRRNSRNDKGFSQAETLTVSSCLNHLVPPEGLEPSTL